MAERSYTVHISISYPASNLDVTLVDDVMAADAQNAVLALSKKLPKEDEE